MLRRIVHKQVKVIQFAIHFDRLGFEVIATFSKMRLRRSIASASNIFFRYFVTKGKGTWSMVLSSEIRPGRHRVFQLHVCQDEQNGNRRM